MSKVTTYTVTEEGRKRLFYQMRSFTKTKRKGDTMSIEFPNADISLDLDGNELEVTIGSRADTSKALASVLKYLPYEDEVTETDEYGRSNVKLVLDTRQPLLTALKDYISRTALPEKVDNERSRDFHNAIQGVLAGDTSTANLNVLRKSTYMQQTWKSMKIRRDIASELLLRGELQYDGKIAEVLKSLS